MMLEDAFGAVEEGAAVRKACETAIADGVCTPDIVPESNHGTEETGDYIVKILEKL